MSDPRSEAQNLHTEPGEHWQPAGHGRTRLRPISTSTIKICKNKKLQLELAIIIIFVGRVGPQRVGPRRVGPQRVEPRRVRLRTSKNGAPGVSHDSPRAQTCTFDCPGFRKHHQNSTRSQPEREREKKE